MMQRRATHGPADDCRLIADPRPAAACSCLLCQEEEFVSDAKLKEKA